MPIQSRNDAAEDEERISRIFAGSAGQRSAEVLQLLVEVLDFNPASGQVGFAGAQARVSPPDAADRIAELDGVHVLHIALPASNTDRVCKAIGVPPFRINEVVHCRRSVPAETASRIGKALCMPPEFWLNIQRMYDLDVARASVDVASIEPLVEASTTFYLPGTRHGFRYGED